ncbi:hypothetical protein DL96DRAFT_1248922 [Flagelloscypha sp. PMI_526]|nr:hypothetical protein DL96DRAFT_1248922 [Flagelloscypha sp. PMI_526]
MRFSTIATAVALVGAAVALPTPEQYEKRLKKYDVELYVEEMRAEKFDIEFEVERELLEIREELHLVKRPETCRGTVTTVQESKRGSHQELAKRPETCRGTVTTVQESRRGVADSLLARSITKPPQHLDAAKADRREPLDGANEDRRNCAECHGEREPLDAASKDAAKM